MKIVRILAAIIFSVALIFFYAAHPSFAESDELPQMLCEWIDAVYRHDQKTGFLHRWSAEDQQYMLHLMTEYEIVPQNTTWIAPENALSEAFIHVYGTGRQWTYVQRHMWDEARVYLGLSDEVYYILPGNEALSEQEAYEAVVNKVSAAVKNGRYPDAETYIASDECSVTTSYMLLDNEECWWFQFYLEGDQLAFLSAYVWNDGQISIEYEDRLAINNVYSDWQQERGWVKYGYWSLQDKYDFYQVMRTLWEREIAYYGVLPPIAITVLEHEHAIPSDDECAENVAISAADEVAAQHIEIQEAQHAVYFYKGNNGECYYQVDYIVQRERVASVKVDPVSGKVISYDIFD